jgi:hypothetical protein
VIVESLSLYTGEVDGEPIATPKTPTACIISMTAGVLEQMTPSPRGRSTSKSTTLQNPCTTVQRQKSLKTLAPSVLRFNNP